MIPDTIETTSTASLVSTLAHFRHPWSNSCDQHSFLVVLVSLDAASPLHPFSRSKGTPRVASPAASSPYAKMEAMHGSCIAWCVLESAGSIHHVM